MKPMLILTTCGTSVLTNGVPEELRKVIFRHANAADEAEIGSDLEVLRDYVTTRRSSLLNGASWDDLKRASAEVAGVLALGVRGVDAGARRLHHLLVHSDTWLGRQAAAIVAPLLERIGGTVELVTGAALRTRSAAEFRWGTWELLEALEGRLPDYEKDGWEIVFQLSGGFKSLNGFLQSYGMVRAHQCVYLFEGSSELVRIPRLPVRLELDRFDPAWTDAFRRIEANYAVSPNAVAAVPGTLWATLDDRVALTQWGDLMWSAARSAVYRTPALTPLSTRLVAAPAVIETLRHRSPTEVESANRSLDTVSAYLDGAVATMPASRQLKPLAGRGPGGATHELYAWSSHGAWRFYGRLEGELLFLDRLERHL